MSFKSEVRSSQAVLQGKIVGIELAIQNVSKLRKDLEENSVTVKAEVQQSVSVHLDLLRQREMQLLRQVDALINHQSAMLQLQLSKLYQVLGRYKAASQWGAENDQTLNMSNFTNEDVSSVSTRHIHYMPHYEKDLSSIISIFGRFEAQGAPRNVLLLPEEEEYGDGDHHVLHKTLQAENAGKVCFPKLSAKSEDWLLTTPSKEMDFDMCETMSNRSSIKSGSIELLSYPEVMDDNQMWLQNTAASANKISSSCFCQDQGDIEIENLDSLVCFPNNAHHNNNNNNNFGNPIMEIPALPSICKSNQAQKCSSFDQCECQESCLISSLKEQLKKQRLSSDFQQQDCINEAIKEAFKQEAGSKTWLLQNDQLNDANKWLAGNNSCCEISSPKEAEIKNAQEPVEMKESELKSTDRWLFTSTQKPITKNEFPAKKFICSEEPSSAWLLSDSAKESEKIDQNVKKESLFLTENGDSWLLAKKKNNLNYNHVMRRQLFDLYFQPIDSNNWLANNNNRNDVQNDKEWLVKC